MSRPLEVYDTPESELPDHLYLVHLPRYPKYREDEGYFAAKPFGSDHKAMDDMCKSRPHILARTHNMAKRPLHGKVLAVTDNEAEAKKVAAAYQPTLNEFLMSDHKKDVYVVTLSTAALKSCEIIVLKRQGFVDRMIEAKWMRSRDEDPCIGKHYYCVDRIPNKAIVGAELISLRDQALAPGGYKFLNKARDCVVM